MLRKQWGSFNVLASLEKEVLGECSRFDYLAISNICLSLALVSLKLTKIKTF